MARKNILGDLTAEVPAGADRAPVSNSVTRPGSAFAARGAPGMLTRSIGDLAAKANAAKELEARLTSGQVIVELDTAVIDPSFIADRMSQNDDAYMALRAAIAADGQSSPILVRPHPVAAGRYQVAFGHRRLRVAQELGRPVRAVVRSLSDQELVLAQGQENSARADLSFIERARFGRRLEDLGYGRDVIMSALGVDKTTVSRMISVTRRISPGVIDAIGPASGTGRDRWTDLASRFEEHKEAAYLALLESRRFQEADSDARFVQVFDLLLSGGIDTPAEKAGRGERIAPREEVQQWGPSRDNGRVVSLTHKMRVTMLSIDRRFAPDFGEFLLSRMDRLFAEYSAAKAEDASADRDSAVGQRGKRAAALR
jgi:ParB family transcriptional regulator, chromosome partitioning protein